MEVTSRLGDDHSVATTYHQLGTSAHERGRFGEAETWYRKSLDVSQRLHDEHLASLTKTMLDTLARARRQSSE